MSRLSSLFLTAPAAATAILLSGCAVTSFAPIAVPDNTSTMQFYDVPKPDAEKIAAELRELQKVTPGDYRIQPGDSFAVVIDGQLEMSRPNVQVMPNGTISVAPIGYVKVAGLTYPEASELLRSKYNAYLRDCNVILEPQTMQPYTFTISGAVQAPGIYPFAFGNFRVSDAVALAKGFQTAGGVAGNRYELADLANAYIIRDGKMLPVNFTEVILNGNTLHNIPLLNGDSIHIPSLESGKVAILGEVSSPDCIPYQPDLTLLQSIAYAGGLKQTNSRDIKVIRGGLKNPVVYNIDIREMRYGRVMDFPLQPRDIVFVPRDTITEWNIIISQIVPTIQLLNGLAGPFGSPSTFLYK